MVQLQTQTTQLIVHVFYSIHLWLVSFLVNVRVTFLRLFSSRRYCGHCWGKLSHVYTCTHNICINSTTFQPVLHDWCNKGRGMCYPVCGMVHIKEPLLLIDKRSLCGGSGFPFSLSEWSLTICLTPYNRR